MTRGYQPKHINGIPNSPPADSGGYRSTTTNSEREHSVTETLPHPNHTATQLQQKQDAIDIATRQLVLDYLCGNLASSPQLLYYQIDNLHALLTELRRG